MADEYEMGNGAFVKPGDWKPLCAYEEGDRVIRNGIEYECIDGKMQPVAAPKMRKRIFGKLFRNLIDIVIYAMLLFPLILLAFPSLSAAAYAGASLILGFFAAEINNIERVIRELFKREKEG